MLKIMGEDTKIFRAWLQQYIKEDSSLSAKTLAKMIGISAQRLSQYYAGRLDNGVRTFPKIPKPIRQAILEATGTEYSEMLEGGKKALSPEARVPEENPDNLIYFNNQIEREHWEVLKTFNDKETALQFNSFLAKLEKLNIKKYEEIYGMVRGLVKEIEQKKKELGQNVALGGAHPPRNKTG